MFQPRSNFARKCEACCTFICERCRQPFISRRGRPTRFCSLTCTNLWQDEPEAREQARQQSITVLGRGEMRRCPTCHEMFYAPGWKLDNGNAKYCSHPCRDYSADLKGINRVLRIPPRKQVNRLEAAGHTILEALGIPYLEQQIIGGKFVVDVLIPSARLVIQWDGDFWHANPKIYPALFLTKIQAMNFARDLSCNRYLAKCGYRVLRFWESDVHARPSWVSREIRRAFANSSST